MNGRQWKTAAVALATLMWAVTVEAQKAEKPAAPDDDAKQQDATKRSQDARRNRGRGERIPDKLKVGDVAPDFTLKSLDGPKTTTLSSFRGKRPVVLIFGSYT